MTKILSRVFATSLLTISLNAKAESVWNTDSCMEHIIRQFTCEVNGKKVFVDLEAGSTQIGAKGPNEGWESMYGVIIKNIEGGSLYIACDDAGDVSRVKFERAGKSEVVACKYAYE